MNKKIKIFVSVILIFALFALNLAFPVASYETDVETSTADMLLINMDTDTIVFSQKPDNNWYAGDLAELMTYLLVIEKINKMDEVTFTVEKSFIDSLPYSDGCLEKYIGKTLTAKDLTAIMLLTSGNDAAYALASLASDGKVDEFVQEMNDRAAAIGCTKTSYVSPGYDGTSDHVTTCRDLYTLYKKVYKTELYREIMEQSSYTPEGMDEEEYTAVTTASLINPQSPYYFKYANDAMYSYTEETYAGIVATTTYRGKTYFFAGLLGLNKSERNVFADAKKLTTWAYLNLSDRKIFNTDDTISGVSVKPDWGEYTIGLYPEYSAFKTLPNTYEADKLSYSFDIPETLQTPFFAGDAVGKVTVFYGGQEVDKIDLISGKDEGLGLYHDFGRFAGYAYASLFPSSDLSRSYENQEGSVSDNESPENDAAPIAAETQAAASESADATEG